MSAGLWLAVGLLGGLGAVGRFLLDGAVGGRGPLPMGTLAINVSGSFVLGVLDGLHVADDVLLLAGTALMGSFTTFSTWMYETQRLVEEDDVRGGALNVAVSLAAGFGAAVLGHALGARQMADEPGS